MGEEAGGKAYCQLNYENQTNLIEYKGTEWCGEKKNCESLVLNWIADIICFQETKLEGEESNWLSRLFFFGLHAWKTMVQGGIIMLWDCRVCKEEVLQIRAHTLTCKTDALLQDFGCHITGVYAPNCYIERRAVQGKQVLLGGWWKDHVLTVVILMSPDFLLKKGIAIRGPEILWNFQIFIEAINLIDL